MDQAALFVLEIAYAIGSLILISAGLAIIFGMMRVINLAHGELLTVGGYAAIHAVHNGVGFFVAILVCAPLAGALVGLVIERVVISRLYGRLIDTMIATWGISLFLIGLMSMTFGTTTTGIASPFGGVSVGEYQFSGYALFVILVAVALVVAMWLVLQYTRVGLIARGTMQSPDMSSAFGKNRKLVYMGTFTAGAALAGFAGGVLAPLVGVVPTSGAQYIAKAFITVIAGGPAVIIGTVTSASFFGTISQVFTLLVTPGAGQIALLVAAVVLLRLLPRGITGRFFKERV